MAWLVIDESSFDIISGPHDDMPEVADGQMVVQTLLGYPQACQWDVAARGFIDAKPPRKIGSAAPHADMPKATGTVTLAKFNALIDSYNQLLAKLRAAGLLSD